MYHYSDDESKREWRNSHFKFPTYKERKNIYFDHLPSNRNANEPLKISKPRASFSEYANRVLSSSLKVIELKNDNFLANAAKTEKKLQPKEKLRLFVEEDTRTIKIKNLEKYDKKMYEVQEANDDIESSDDSEKEKRVGGNKFSEDKIFRQLHPKKIDRKSFQKFLPKKNEADAKNYSKFHVANVNDFNLEGESGSKMNISIKFNSEEKGKQIDYIKENLLLLGLFALDKLVKKENQPKNQIKLSKTWEKLEANQEKIQKEADIETKKNILLLPINNYISLFKNSSESIAFSSKVNDMIASNSSFENKLNSESNNYDYYCEEKKNEDEFSVKTDSSSDEYSSTEVRYPSSSGKKLISSLNTQNSIISFKQNKNLQRKSVSIVSGFIPNKLHKRDSISISKKEMNDMGVNLEILRLGNCIKENKNRINYADLLKGLMELFIRNACSCDTVSLRSNSINNIKKYVVIHI